MNLHFTFPLIIEENKSSLVFLISNHRLAVDDLLNLLVFLLIELCGCGNTTTTGCWKYFIGDSKS